MKPIQFNWIEFDIISMPLNKNVNWNQVVGNESFSFHLSHFCYGTTCVNCCIPLSFMPSFSWQFFLFFLLLQLRCRVLFISNRINLIYTHTWLRLCSLGKVFLFSSISIFVCYDCHTMAGLASSIVIQCGNSPNRYRQDKLSCRFWFAFTKWKTATSARIHGKNAAFFAFDSQFRWLFVYLSLLRTWCHFWCA